MTSTNELKQAAAKAAIQYVIEDSIIGVGTGSTVNYFIDELAKIKHKISGAIASSKITEKRLKSHSIPVYDLNSISNLPVYIDGADEFNTDRYLIKGGGGALTREKIIAAHAENFICIADESKKVDVLGNFPLPIEVISIARNYVAREMKKLGGNPVYREGFITDNNHAIIDIHNLSILNPIEIEEFINHITGVISNGLFAKRPADKILMATPRGITLF